MISATVLAAMQVWQFRVAVTHVSAASAAWACPRLKIRAASGRLARTSSSFPSMYNAGVNSLPVTSKSALPWAVGSSPCWCVSTSEFPRWRLRCLHMAGALAEDLQEVVLLCLATNSPRVWRTTLEMALGMLALQAVAKVTSHIRAFTPLSRFRVSSLLSVRCSPLASACCWHTTAPPAMTIFGKKPCVQSRAFCLSLSVSGAGHHSSAEGMSGTVGKGPKNTWVATPLSQTLFE